MSSSPVSSSPIASSPIVASPIVVSPIALAADMTREVSPTSAQAFYQRLETDLEFHRTYVAECSGGVSASDPSADPSANPSANEAGSQSGALRPWPEPQVLTFAANHGYQFGLGDLYRVWFEHEDYLAQTLFVDSLNSAGITLVKPAAEDQSDVASQADIEQQDAEAIAA